MGLALYYRRKEQKKPKQTLSNVLTETAPLLEDESIRVQALIDSKAYFKNRVDELRKEHNDL